MDLALTRQRWRMDDPLTKSVLQYQEGRVSLNSVRNQVMMEAYAHLTRYRRRSEDEISDFLLDFHSRIEGLLSRFGCRGVPFRHYLRRTLKWQWATFQVEQSAARRRSWLAADHGLGAEPAEGVAEPVGEWSTLSPPALSSCSHRRLVLLILKAAPFLEESHLEVASRHTGTELPWLQACQGRLQMATDRRRGRRRQLAEKRGETYYRRLMAEDDARREIDPERRGGHEHRAVLYRNRLSNLARQQRGLSTSPTHLELSSLLGMPKGSIDSGLYHLKKELTCVYSGEHDDDPAGHQQ